MKAFRQCLGVLIQPAAVVRVKSKLTEHLIRGSQWQQSAANSIFHSGFFLWVIQISISLIYALVCLFLEKLEIFQIPPPSFAHTVVRFWRISKRKAESQVWRCWQKGSGTNYHNLSLTASAQNVISLPTAGVGQREVCVKFCGQTKQTLVHEEPWRKMFRG